MIDPIVVCFHSMLIQNNILQIPCHIIKINSTDGLSMTIQAYMSFEDPIDDIKQVTLDYRGLRYDFQSISRERADQLLTLVLKVITRLKYLLCHQNK